jgi:putative ABC transport system permease protein
MLGNYLAAAIRNFGRNRLYGFVTIAGLAIGFAAAMLIGLYVRDELTFDHGIPRQDRVYAVTQTIQLGATPPREFGFTPVGLARSLRLDFPQLEAVARLAPSPFPPAVRREAFPTAELNFYWADPDFFRVFPLPTLAGDLAHALDAPDSLVLTQAAARRYFGNGEALGKVLRVNEQPMRVTAVLNDLPSNSNLPFEIVASGRSAQSPTSQLEAHGNASANIAATYVRFKAGASVDAVTQHLGDYLDARVPNGPLPPGAKLSRDLHMVPLAQLHLRKSVQSGFEGKPPGDAAVVGAIAIVGVLIVIVASINFVTLMTARATRRAVEVGVRKSVGARRRDLIGQFMAETFLYVLAAAALAISFCEVLLPAANAMLQRKLTFDYFTDPRLAAVFAATIVLTGLLAGLYPAIVLSSFRPAQVLKGGAIQGVGGGRIREVLVVGQFAVLVGLVLVATVIFRQTHYALNEGMRVDKDQVLLLFASPCSETMRDEVQRVAGVRRAACASADSLNLSEGLDSVTAGGRPVDVWKSPVDFGFFEVFGIRPLAGRTFQRARTADAAATVDSYQPVILNETGARRLGFATPQAAIGKSFIWHGLGMAPPPPPTSGSAPADVPAPAAPPPDVPLQPPAKASVIIGVVPDFTLGSMRQAINPIFYVIGPNQGPASIALAVKLDGSRLPETTAEVQQLWRRLGGGRPYLATFVDQYTRRLYIDTQIQGDTIAVAGLVALVVAALGLFALSAYTTERRTKEIGVRKVMGARSRDILWLLLWQFTKPVVWANLVAWPIAYLVMRWWLASFAYHVAIAAWLFIATGAGALVIAWVTVFIHALQVARARPVTALRYE